MRDCLWLAEALPVLERAAAVDAAGGGGGAPGTALRAALYGEEAAGMLGEGTVPTRGVERVEVASDGSVRELWAAAGLPDRPTLYENGAASIHMNLSKGEDLWGSGDQARTQASRERKSKFVRIDGRHGTQAPKELLAHFDKLGAPYGEDALQACYDGVPGFVSKLFARRFWILGAGAAGSTWHTDMLNSSFYNAVVSGGAKQWLLLPGDVRSVVGAGHGEWGERHRERWAGMPGGGYLAHESLFNEVRELDSSAWEWFRGFRGEARRLYGPDLLEVRVEVGELLYVPPGWWHMTVNVDDNLAVSENFVEPRHLGQSMQVMEDILSVPDGDWPEGAEESKGMLKACFELMGGKLPGT
jgi:hypothetical protein